MDDSWRRKAPDLFDSSVDLPALGDRMRRPEVMAPAGGWPQLRAAVFNGADAVYLGLTSFSARARASNFDPGEELHAVVHFCRVHEVKVYVALNTLVFDEEMDEVAALIIRCNEAGVDAVIVQDLGVQRLVRELAPELPIHASTQQSISSADGAEFARSLGASRVVVGRELSTVDVARVVTSTLAEVEVFVHGALCISWSGQCFSSEAWGGRSANRGQCAQACRLPYSLVINCDERPDCDVSYLLSPQDLCGLDQVPALVEAGVSCLKIEGRLKDERYTAAVTRAYRNAVDKACGGGDPRVVVVDRQQLAQVFSRAQDGTHDGLSMGFLAGADHQRLVRGRSPRHRGVLAGSVLDAGFHDGYRRWSSLWIVVEPRLADLKAGDGVVIDIDGARDDEIGGRLAAVKQLDDNSSRVVCTFEPTERVNLPSTDFVAAGALLWRTSDPKVDAELGRLANPSAKLRPRRTEVRAALRAINTSVAELSLNDGIRIAFATVPLAEAASSDEHTIRSAFGELGNTPWRLAAFEIALPRNRKAKAADVKAARRAAVAELAQLRQPASRRSIRSAVSALPQIQEQRTPNTKTHRAGISLLVRSLAQCKAAVAAASVFKGCDFFDVDEIVLDFLEVTGLETALDLVRASKATSVIAAPRILLPNEGKVIQRILDLRPDALLVRSTGLLHAVREAPISKRGDFSLNAVNQIAAHELLREGNLDRLTASYDLSANAVARLASRLPPGQFEAVVHSHLPIFHSSHCVFARHLSEGSDYTNCELLISR